MISLRIRMAVGDAQIDPAVIVVIEELSPPADIRNTDRGHSGIVGNIGERIGSNVAVKDIVFIVEGGNEYIEPSVVIIVAHSDAHAALLATVSVDRRTRFESDLAKRTIPVVMVEIVRRRVVGYENIHPSVSIKVTGDDVQAVVTDRVVNAGLFGHVGKRPVAIVVIEGASGALVRLEQVHR